MIAAVLNLRRRGIGYNEIAQTLGMDKQKVGYICRRNGLGGFVDGRSKPLDEKEVSECVSKCGFDYVGGYSKTKHPITVRCRCCGETFERQYHIFRDVVNGTWNAENDCPVCKRKKQEQKRIDAEHEAQKRAKLKEEMKAERLSREVDEELSKRLAIHVCKNCGKEFCQMVTGYNSKTYCSEKCQKRYFNRGRSEKRHKKLMARRHDTDISLEKLFKRDGGVCYICRRVCDWHDGEWRDGTFIAGPSYPSIDHVVPVAKGGTHTWSNVKLACRECNWTKRDST